MQSGCEAWLMLVQPSSNVVAMEADTCTGAGEGSAGSAKPSRWENVVAEYVDVFEPPGMLADRDTMQCIEVEPGSEPPFRQQYWYLLLNLQKSGVSWTSISNRAGLGPHARHTEPPSCLYVRKLGSSV